MATVQPDLATLPTQMATTHAKAKDNPQQITINSAKVNQGCKNSHESFADFLNKTYNRTRNSLKGNEQVGNHSID